MKESPDTRHIPIIMVTARTDEIDRVVGFELGVDDYVTKPFSMRELLLRIKRTLQRYAEPAATNGAISESDLLRIDRAAHRVLVERHEVDLSLLEYRILETLVENRGRVMTRGVLLDVVWGKDCSVSQRTIDAHIKRLRDRLGVAGACVETVRGVGYRFASLTNRHDADGNDPA
jgi:two-component system phosphate regulon response regulator PhoB